MGVKGQKQKNTKWETIVYPRLSEIQKWCEEGLTNDVICKRLNIAQSTWYEYQKEYPMLSELVKMGKSVIDSQVENSLLKAALGYDYEEIKTIVEEDKNGKKRTRIEKVKRHQPPNPTAMIFWLKNRAPDNWNDRREIMIDTKQSELERKQLFLQMIEEEAQDEVIEGEYSIIEECETEEEFEEPEQE
ncbi:transposase [Aneurinibacillus aneurinilyticus]|jgi:hypothetical protein|uniref:transposase n=1 Tax=Aneurinibacillus aneurinilyticus TaxID=1391 RepID=UPI0023F7D977|nr:transposase [Aneurinibacillus aneurinilyticus]MCI1693296.1 transposase [Aneurinibacillus aneurinilyticus]